MPLDDWTRVPESVFGSFARAWITALQGALNSGLLPPDFYALAEAWPRQTSLALRVGRTSSEERIALVYIVLPRDKEDRVYLG